MRRVSGLRFAGLTALLGILFLAACSEEAPGPQFANEPAPTREATATAVIASPLPILATPVAMATPSSISDLLNVRGAPDVVFTASASTLWMIGANGDATRLYQAPAGTRILSFDAGPSSREVAVLTELQDDTRSAPNLLILDRAGKLRREVSGFSVAVATPAATAVRGADLVNWSPQGDRALVALRGGQVYDVQLDGDAAAEPLRIGTGVEVVQPTWSPTGESIAYIAADASRRSRNLDVYDIASGNTRTIVEATDGRFVVDFVWMPDGVTVLFTEGGELGGAVSGIDLWRIGGDGADRSLLASAGTVAPVARITTMRPSPDGRSVAYAVLVPGDDGPIVDSVWVRDIATGVGFRIPLATITSINDIIWTEQGVVASVVTGGPGSKRPEMLAMLLVDRQGEVSVLWAAPVAAATPVSATPIASPVSR